MPTININDVVELIHNHLCGLRIIENKNRKDIKIEYGLNEDMKKIQENN